MYNFTIVYIYMFMSVNVQPQPQTPDFKPENSILTTGHANAQGPGDRRRGQLGVSVAYPDEGTAQGTIMTGIVCIRPGLHSQDRLDSLTHQTSCPSTGHADAEGPCDSPRGQVFARTRATHTYIYIYISIYMHVSCI